MSCLHFRVLSGSGFEIFKAFGFGFFGFGKKPQVRVGFSGSGKLDPPLQSMNLLQAATRLFHDIAPWLVKTIEASNRDVVKATHVIANELKMKNDFPVFMAVMDLAWFRPDLIDPASKVPTGLNNKKSLKNE